MAPQSPAVAQLELTIRLRRRRAELGLSARNVSDHLEFSPNHWSNVENNRTILAADKIRNLADLFEFDDAEIQELLYLRKVARGRRWWDEYQHVLDGTLAQYYGLEFGATSLRTFEASIVPGLLQTEDYASALTSADPDTNDARLRKRIDLRLRRKKRLFGADPLMMVAVVSQAALMQQIGGPMVLRQQLLHLVDLSEQLDKSILEFRVVPFTATPRGLLNVSTMHLLDFSSPHLPTLAWREAVEPLGITDDPDLLDLLLVSFDRALASTLDHAKSIAVVRDLAEDLNDVS